MQHVASPTIAVVSGDAPSADTPLYGALGAGAVGFTGSADVARGIAMQAEGCSMEHVDGSASGGGVGVLPAVLASDGARFLRVKELAASEREFCDYVDRLHASLSRHSHSTEITINSIAAVQRLSARLYRDLSAVLVEWDDDARLAGAAGRMLPDLADHCAAARLHTVSYGLVDGGDLVSAHVSAYGRFFGAVLAATPPGHADHRPLSMAVAALAAVTGCFSGSSHGGDVGSDDGSGWELDLSDDDGGDVAAGRRRCVVEGDITEAPRKVELRCDGSSSDGGSNCSIRWHAGDVGSLGASRVGSSAGGSSVLRERLMASSVGVGCDSESSIFGGSSSEDATDTDYVEFSEWDGDDGTDDEATDGAMFDWVLDDAIITQAEAAAVAMAHLL